MYNEDTHMPTYIRMHKSVHIEERYKDFLRKSRIAHGDTYYYFKNTYTKRKDKMVMACSKHGVFTKSPQKHIDGQGCPTCSKERRAIKSRKSNDTFIKECIEVHGNRYDYNQLFPDGWRLDMTNKK